VGAALEVFAAHDEDGVGLEDLAAAAGVTRNLLYRYFDGRSALHRAALDLAIERLAARLDTDARTPLAAKLPRNVAMWMDAVEHDDPAMAIVLRAGRSADPAVRARYAAAREALTRAIAFNHLGMDDPPAHVLAALDGYLALAERLIERRQADDLSRGEVEQVLADTLPPLVAAVAKGPRPQADVRARAASAGGGSTPATSQQRVSQRTPSADTLG
jgi:AcrR family transcriptional regulator